jgi:hypothetical protein
MARAMPENLGDQQQEDRRQVGEVGDDQDLLESVAIGEGPGNHRNAVRDHQEDPLHPPQRGAREAEGGHVDPEAHVDAVVGEPLQDLDAVGDPEYRRKGSALFRGRRCGRLHAVHLTRVD